MKFSFSKKRANPEKCATDILNKYSYSEKVISKMDYQRLKSCLEKWDAHENPEFLGAMAYVRYREGEVNKMWDYIEKDLELELEEYAHGAFIPAIMADVNQKMRYEILKNIHTHLKDFLSLELMAKNIETSQMRTEVMILAREFEIANPQHHRVKKLISDLDAEQKVN